MQTIKSIFAEFTHAENQMSWKTSQKYALLTRDK